MEITFILWGQLRDAAGKSNVIIEVNEGARLKDTAFKLAEVNESLSHVLIADSGQLRASNLAFINGAQTSWDADAELTDKSEITLMSPIAGG